MFDIENIVSIFLQSLLVRTPTLLVYLAGIIIVIVHFNHKPLAARYALAGLVTLLLLSVIGSPIMHLISQWLITSSTTYVPLHHNILYFCFNMLFAVGDLLLIRAIFVNDRQRITREQLQQILEDE